MNRWWLAAVAPALVVLAVGPPVGAADKKTPAKRPAADVKDDAGKKEADKKPVVIEPAEFAMEEVPAFGKEEVGGQTRNYYPGGAYTMCGTAPNKEVKEYPKLKSKRPLYGSVTFDANYFDPKAGKTFYFVLDESGEKKPKAEKKTAEAEKKTDEGAEEPQMPAWKYDRLYFDCNGDLDLTNDGVVKPAEKSPFEGMPEMTMGGFFEELKVTFDFGPPVGKRPFALVPCARPYSAENVLMQFLTKTARKGKIRLGGDEYVARLSQSRIVSGRYDRPMVQLELYPVDASKPARLLPGFLGQMRLIDGQFVSLSATPLGDKLRIEPYRGDTGVLEVGAGGRAVTDLGVTGQLVSSKGIMIAMGENVSQKPEAMPRRYSLPVGDYLLPNFMAQHGRLRFSGRMAANIGPGADTKDAGPSYPIQIRKDKPYVLKFSGKPEVKFMDPAKDRSFKPGENIRIAAMLTEPWQGMQITGLWEASDKEGKPTNARLDPNIAIRNAAGEVVTEGKMPFG